MADFRPNLLAQQEWQAADQVTQALLLQSVQAETQESLLVTPALAQIPFSLLHQLNYRWQSASQGWFGFAKQQAIYTKQRPI